MMEQNWALDGIIDDIVQKSQHSTTEGVEFSEMKPSNLGHREISQVISHIENKGESPIKFPKRIFQFLELRVQVGRKIFINR